MPRPSAEAVNAAIRHVYDQALGQNAAGPLQTLLIFKRMERLGQEWSIDAVEERVQELFALLPDEPLGRLSLEGGDRLWRVLKASGRKTVWDNATRTGARDLFEPPGAWDKATRDSHPLRDDAVAVAVAKVPAAAKGRRIAQDALAVLLSWDTDFPEGADLDDVLEEVRGRFGLGQQDWLDLTSEPILDAGFDPFDGPEWMPETLPPELRPGRAVIAVADRRVDHDPAVIPLRVDDRTMRMVRLAILSTSAVLLVGPPGTGKTRLLREIATELLDNHHEFANVAEPLWSTPEESWTSREIVGGPTVVPGSNEIRFRPGLVPRSIAENRWLILDELNRGDADRIFGGLITWLSDQPVEIGRILEEPHSPIVHLDWGTIADSAADPSQEPLTAKSPTEDVTYRAGRSWRLLGTYNGQDAQRVFRFGQALGRRFQQVPVPAMDPDDFDAVLATLDEEEALPPLVAERVASLYKAHHDDPETRLGPASFFKVRTYLAQALAAPDTASDRSAPDDADPAPSGGVRVADATAAGEELLEELVAEGYVISLGQRLAALDETILQDLGKRILTAEALTKEQWAWAQDRIRDFG